MPSLVPPYGSSPSFSPLPSPLAPETAPRAAEQSCRALVPSGRLAAPLRLCKRPLGRPACGKLSRQFRLDPDPADNTVVHAPIEEFWRAIRLDLFWHLPGLPFGIPTIIASGGGSVINMASNVALMGVAGLDCYTAAKGGIAAITRSMAAEFAPQKVRLNAIALAATMTDRVRSRFEAGNPRVTKIAAAHLIGLIEPDDIANMAVFLASDESRMVTGHVHPVDIGNHHFLTRIDCGPFVSSRVITTASAGLSFTSAQPPGSVQRSASSLSRTSSNLLGSLPNESGRVQQKIDPPARAVWRAEHPRWQIHLLEADQPSAVGCLQFPNTSAAR